MPFPSEPGHGNPKAANSRVPEDPDSDPGPQVVVILTRERLESKHSGNFTQGPKYAPPEVFPGQDIRAQGLCLFGLWLPLRAGRERSMSRH